MKDYKTSVKNSLFKYLQKQSVQELPKSKNLKPEKLTEKEVIQSLYKLGFLHRVVESKATFSVSQQRYASSQVKPGTADILACSPDGEFVAIELKALGRRSNLSPEQRVFLEAVIARGGFACCADSSEYFLNLWSAWKKSPSKELLLKALPGKRSGNDTIAKQALFTD